MVPADDGELPHGYCLLQGRTECGRGWSRGVSREGGKEGRREGGKEGRREGGKEGRREG